MHYIRQPWHQESSTALERADADHRLREEAVPSASARGGGHLIATLRVARVAKGSCGPQAATWVAGLASAPCHRLSHRRPFFWHSARSLSIAGVSCRSTPRSCTCSRAPRARLARISWPMGWRRSDVSRQNIVLNTQATRHQTLFFARRTELFSSSPRRQRHTLRTARQRPSARGDYRTPPPARRVVAFLSRTKA